MHMTILQICTVVVNNVPYRLEVTRHPNGNGTLNSAKNVDNGKMEFPQELKPEMLKKAAKLWDEWWVCDPRCAQDWEEWKHK